MANAAGADAAICAVEGAMAIAGSGSALSMLLDSTSYFAKFYSMLAAHTMAVIGSYPGYLLAASSLGAFAYSIPEEDWEELGALGDESAQWGSNLQALQAIMAHGIPVYATNYPNPGTWLWDEFEWLIKNGNPPIMNPSHLPGF